MIRVPCNCPCHALLHHHVPAAGPVSSPETSANEVRGRWGVNELAAEFGIDAVPAYDERGAATGRVAIDPADVQEAIRNYYAETDEEGN